MVLLNNDLRRGPAAAGRGADADLPARIDTVARDLGYALDRDFDPNAVKSAMSTDKKRHRGRQRWVLPMAVGRTEEADDVSEAELDRAIAHIHSATVRGIAA